MIPWRAGMVAVVLAALAGCATWRPPTDHGDESLRARAVSRSAHGVSVSASLLSADDSRQLLGVDIIAKGIQPVWLEIANGTESDLWLLRSGTGPDYFSPLEAAWTAHVRFGGDTNDRIDQRFEQVGVPAPVPAGQTRRGLLYLTPQPRRMVLNLDLFGDRLLVPISLILTVPGAEQDDQDLEMLEAASIPKVDHGDLDSLRTALESLPHCAGSVGVHGCGQPLNAVFVGSIEDIGAASSRRDFRRDLRQADQALRLFDRAPDFVARKHAPGASAIWIRAWLAPVTYRGKPIFVARVARPAGGRFADSDMLDLPLYGGIDEARDRLIQDAMYSGGLQAVGFLTSTGSIPRSHPAKTGDGSSYFTDGHRAVLFFETRPLAISDVQFLDWVPLVQQAEERARAPDEDGAVSPE